MTRACELLIVGGGAAGLTAGLYAARARLDAVLLDRMGGAGGQLLTIDHIENYPGYPAGIPGAQLGPLIAQQAADAGLELTLGEAIALRPEPAGRWRVESDAGAFIARAVILAMGSTLARTGVDGEAQFEGRGVSYCATCDGMFAQGQPVVVVGGGDSALDEARYLATIASSVTIVHRRGAFRAERLAQERILEDPKCRVLWEAAVTRIVGDTTVTGVDVRDASGQHSFLPARGVFIYTGLVPATGWLRGIVATDPAGHITVDAMLRTTAAGVFAAGDIRQHSARQVASAAGDGATAAIAAERYLRGPLAR